MEAVRSSSISSCSDVETPYGIGGLLVLVKPSIDVLTEVLLQALEYPQHRKVGSAVSPLPREALQVDFSSCARYLFRQKCGSTFPKSLGPNGQQGIGVFAGHFFGCPSDQPHVVASRPGPPFLNHILRSTVLRRNRREDCTKGFSTITCFLENDPEANERPTQ
jgi:hypothetical protein